MGRRARPQPAVSRPELQARFAAIREVRAVGLMWGFELNTEGAPVVAACRERGLLVNRTQGNIIRLLPPLIIDETELDEGLAILTAALETTCS